MVKGFQFLEVTQRYHKASLGWWMVAEAQRLCPGKRWSLSLPVPLRPAPPPSLDSSFKKRLTGGSPTDYNEVDPKVVAGAGGLALPASATFERQEEPMPRSGIRRVIQEHTIKHGATTGIDYHSIRWSFEVEVGRPTTAGVYSVPDDDWPLLAGLLRIVGEMWPTSNPGALVRQINAIATRSGWEVQP